MQKLKVERESRFVGMKDRMQHAIGLGLLLGVITAFILSAWILFGGW